LNSPLITDFLLPSWLESIPEPAQEGVRAELARIIDEERHAGEFVLTLKATLVVGKKARLQSDGSRTESDRFSLRAAGTRYL
jgi:hypothetical protein